MSSEKNKKGNRVEYSTFFSWGKSEIIGYEKTQENGKTFVTKVWCKICAKHKEKINKQLKGSAVTHAKAFVEGTNSVTKHQVSGFLSSRFLFRLCHTK